MTMRFPRSVRILVFVYGALVAGTDVTAQVFYESNAAGMLIVPIAESRTGELEYVVRISEAGGERIETLLRDGAPIRSIVIRKNRTEREERVYEGGQLVAVRIFSGSVPVEESRFVDGVLRDRYLYASIDGKIVSSRRYDGAGKLVETVVYERTDSGRLAGARFSAENASRLSIYRFDGSTLYESWLGEESGLVARDAGGGTLYRYDGGTLSGTERWKGDRLVEVETMETFPGGYRRIRVDYENGRKMVFEYGNDDRLQLETAYAGDSRIEQTRFLYKNGYLAESVRLDASGSERRVYIRDPESVLLEEKIIVNGILQKAIIYTGDDSRYEEIYRNGTAALRIYFDEDRRVSEEVLQ